jgi:pilus assembly protein CpaE
MDVQHGNAALYMDLDNNVGVMDLVDSAERLDASLLEGVMARHDAGIEVLAAPRDMVPLDIVTPGLLDTCLTVARSQYRYVLVDLPGAWTDWSLRILQQSQMIVVVTQLTVSHVRRTRRLLDTLAVNQLDNVPIKVLVNRFEKTWGKSVNIKAANKALGRPVDFCVMNDYRTVSDAINQGVSLSEIASRTKVEKSLRQFVDTAIGELSEGDERAEPRLKISFGR